jgi:dTMP kinase
MNGKFIVIEGLEGAGKSTAVALCNNLLNQHGIDFVNTREPGGTPLAEQLRALVKDHHDEIVTSQTELLIMYAARSQLVANVIKPNLSNGVWVLGDRHDLSSRAYQGGGRELPLAQLDSLGNIVLNDLRPDLTLYLDVTPEIGLARARGRGELDRIELESLAFFERTRAVYLAACEADSTCVKIDATVSVEQVANQISVALTQFIEGNK